MTLRYQTAGNVRKLLPFLVLMAASFSCHSFAEGPLKPKAVFATEFREIERAGIALIEREFPDSSELADFVRRYRRSDTNALYVANFNAIQGYIQSTLEPDFPSPTASQTEAFRTLRSLSDKHDGLQVEYSRIYGKLPSFD